VENKPDPVQAQLTLPVSLRDEATFDNYLPLTGSKTLLQTLQQDDVEQTRVLVHGPAGSGKSHILQAACHRVGHQAQYLPLAELKAYAPRQVLHDVEHMGLVCLDDIEQVLGNAEWEMALFNLYNLAQQTGCGLLMAARASPAALPVELPDLRSRLAWGLVFRLVEASDEEKVQILCFRAGRRGLQLPQEVAKYMVHRAQRGMADLLDLLDALDKASLTQQRSLSIPFVKKSLGL